ncbi:MAG: hypothetical protein V7L27_27430 [Nostoc sp.]
MGKVGKVGKPFLGFHQASHKLLTLVNPMSIEYVDVVASIKNLVT